MNVMDPLTQPLDGSRCRACGATLDAESATCKACGAAYGQQNRCPHCGAVAGIEDRGDIGRCRLCGGPRIPVDDPATIRSGRELPLLRQAERARHEQTVARWAAGLTAIAGLALAIMAGLSGIITHAGWPVVVGLVIGGLALLASLLLARRARSAVERRQSLLGAARQLVAADVLTSHAGRLEATELARILHVPVEEAELTLAELSLDEVFHTRVLEPAAPTWPTDRTAQLVTPDSSEVEASGSLPPTTERLRNR